MTKPTWAEILAEALDKALTGKCDPVPGARLRPILDRVAAEHDLSFPPEDRPELKFGEFLREHSDVAAVLPRPGQDILVVPADRLELFAVHEGDVSLATGLPTPIARQLSFGR